MLDSTGLSPARMTVEGHGGASINVWGYGGDGPPLLLAHCTGTHARVWDPLVPQLLESFRVFAADTRGHGDSEKVEDPNYYRWSHSGDDLLAVIDALGVGPDIFGCGHSAGAAHIAYAEWKRPGAFKKAVLIDPIIGPPQAFSGDNPLAELSRRRRNDFESKQAAFDRYSSRPPLNAWDPAVLAAYVEHGFDELPDGSATLKCPGHIEAIVYEGSGASDVFEHLGDLNFEVVLATSTESNVRALAEFQKDRFSRLAEYVVFENCSHFIPQERPTEVVDLVLRSLG